MEPSEVPLESLRIPIDWPAHLKSALIHAVAFAHTAMVNACSFAQNVTNPRLQREAEIARLQMENARKDEQINLLLSRFSRIPHHERPHYKPHERFRALLLKALCGWSQSQAASALLVEPLTIHLWEKKLHEEGEPGFLDIGAPVNRFPDYVGVLVTRLKALCPMFGKVKIAQVLARAGVHFAVSTIKRKLGQDDGSTPDPDTDATVKSEEETDLVVTARYPNHVWHVDLTVMPTLPGFWVPWSPLACLQCWPFCWWLFVVLDHHSRRIMKTGLFKNQPSSEEVCSALDAAACDAGQYPKHIISDKGSQFHSKDAPTAYQKWCERNSVKPRFGKVGKKGSISVVERCIRTLKELLRRILIPYRLDLMAEELAWTIEWYNTHRPHMTLGGATPDEKYYNLPLKNEQPRLEPRLSYPPHSPCASPQVPIRGSPGAQLKLCVTFLAGRKHLPMVEVHEVA